MPLGRGRLESRNLGSNATPAFSCDYFVALCGISPFIASFTMPHCRSNAARQCRWDKHCDRSLKSVALSAASRILSGKEEVVIPTTYADDDDAILTPVEFHKHREYDETDAEVGRISFYPISQRNQGQNGTLSVRSNCF